MASPTCTCRSETRTAGVAVIRAANPHGLSGPLREANTTARMVRNAAGISNRAGVPRSGHARRMQPAMP